MFHGIVRLIFDDRQTRRWSWKTPMLAVIVNR